MRIGIDIGGTNTHAVLIGRKGELLATSSHFTTANIWSGVRNAVKNLLEKKKMDPKKVDGIFIGTTELLKAILEEKVLAKSALIRIGRQPTKIAPALNWPPSLKVFLQGIYFLKSQNRYNGAIPKKQTDWNLEPLFRQMESQEVEAVCITGTYSPMYEEEELFVKTAIKSRFPEIPITVSHQLGSIGFIERENASLLNTLLSKLISGLLTNLKTSFTALSLECPFWFTQNNGSLMSVQEAVELPVFTIASGVANSLRGASLLSVKKDMIAIDVGGSMIHLGKIRNGQLREVANSTRLLGIDANLDMPEFISLPFGGGSMPAFQHGELELLPPKWKEIEKDGLSWGGQTWTVSDSFLKLYPDSFYDPRLDLSRLASLDRGDCERVVEYCIGQIKHALDLLQGHEEELPIVLVGGGSPLLNEQLFGKYKQVINPAGYPFSSAIGACFAPVSNVVDKVYWLNRRTKEAIIEEAVNTCKTALLDKGADPDSIQVSYVEEYPFAYLKGEILRVKTKATGEFVLSSRNKRST